MKRERPMFRNGRKRRIRSTQKGYGCLGELLFAIIEFLICLGALVLVSMLVR